MSDDQVSGTPRSDFDEKIIAMVAIKDSVPIEPGAVAERVKSMFPWLAASIGTPPPQPEGNDTFLIPMGEAAVAVVPIHFPIPNQILARALVKNWFWPEAREAFQNSRAHIIVSILTPTNDPRYTRRNAQRLTCATAALTQMLPATGVYWATADNVIAPDHFISEAKEIGEDGTPYDLWVTVDFFPGPNFQEDKEIIARSNGLHVFIGREIECGPYVQEPGEIGVIVRTVGWYVLDRRVEFVGGETLELNETNVIGRVELGRTALQHADSKAVYRVVMGDGLS